MVQEHIIKEYLKKKGKMTIQWTIELPIHEGIYLFRHKGVPQFVSGMNLKKMSDGTLMKVNGCTVTPFTEGYSPMPDSCLTYSDFLASDSCRDFEYWGPIE